MDWGEIRARTDQEFNKHRDLLMHRIGVTQSALRLDAGHGTPPGRFLFPGAGNESSARAALLRTHLPDEASAIVREADEISNHRFRLLGYEPLRFSLEGGKGDDEIDWHLDPVHGKRAPRAPWFKIPFLDFGAVGDHKVIWELNRHQHLVTLAKAQLLTGDDQYLRELMTQWRSWMKANPYPLGINWASTLEVAFRSLSWIWIDQLLAGTTAYADFRSELLPALAFHARYIERYLSAYFSPNTHLLGEAVALFFLGTLYPQFPRAAISKRSAWKIVLHEAERQIRPDGVYFEQSLYYHVYALDFFLYARLLSVRNDIQVPASYDAVLERMLDVIAALAQSGPAEGFGDDDGGRVFNPRRNRTEHMTDPLALGALTYSKQFPATQLTEEAIWLFGKQAVEELPRFAAGAPPHSMAFPDGGLYVLADPESYRQALVVDAGPQGEGRSGHGHADALGVRLTMTGQRWLVDPGTGVYIAQDSADRNSFRGTGAHNTLRVDGVDQAVPEGPFSWSHIPTTQTESWVVGKSFSYFVGSHNGYARLDDPVIHRRHILKLTGGPLLVRDIAIGRAEHELDLLWHFAPDLEFRNDRRDRGLVEMAKIDASPGESSLCFLMPEDLPWATSTEITRLSPAYGALQAAPLVRRHARVLLPAETATVLVTREVRVRQDNEALAEAHLVSIAEASVQAYELNYHNESHSFFFALGETGWGFGPWSSDARMLYCRIGGNALRQMIAIGATQVEWRGQALLRTGKKFEFFEWRARDEAMKSASGEVSVTALFEELADGSRSLAAELNPTSRPSPDKNARPSAPFAEKH